MFEQRISVFFVKKPTMCVNVSLSLPDLVRVPFTSAFAVSNGVFRRGGEADGGRV